jgi:predicted RNA-binding protein YlqC (UPF0109 family)
MTKEINVDAAIDLLKSGGNLEQITISDLATSKTRMMDALLLARNGYTVPDSNVIYDDNQIQYDPDFDEMAWGKPVAFKKLKQPLETDEQLTETSELILKLHIESTDMGQWLAKNGNQINLIISGLLESMYKADKLAK